MESPTIELSRGLEALKLAGQLEGQTGAVKQGAPPSAMPTAQTREKDANLLLANSDASSSHHEIKERLTHGFDLSKSSHSIHDSHVCPHHLQPDNQPPFLCSSNTTCSYCMQKEALYQRLTISSQSSSPAPPTQKDYTKHSCGNCVCIVDSLNTLSVSCSQGQGHTVSALPQSVALLRSCREEAAAGASRNYLDDTTVDDLAGYLDEIMFIPKPMSEMAELMYT